MGMSALDRIPPVPSAAALDAPTSSISTSPLSVSRPTSRNLALDVFRGLALVTIFINHMPFNPWYWATPSRFGLSDATEVFVFISGCVAALAYGRRWLRDGWKRSTGRVATRIAQIYAAHLLMFAVLLTLCVAGNRLATGHDYVQDLNLTYALTHMREAALGLMTLTYVPNYFDILPMYLVIVALVPVILAIGRYSARLAVLVPLALYALAHLYRWELPAEPSSDRSWYFNPLCWQLIFFTGFAFGAGYLRVPRPRVWLLALCSFTLAASALIEYGATYFGNPHLNSWRNALAPYADKSHLDLLRIIHFLMLAYVVSCALRLPRLHKLLHSWPARQLARMGRNGLSMFVLVMIGSYVGGMALDVWGRSPLPVALINLAGLSLMMMSAAALERYDLWAHQANSQTSRPQPATAEPSAVPLTA